ncbi:hypothetical protein SAMN05444392_102214 [Seinonella peptonophila]|uniref:Uncharacterized protein n=2 Tax=Seinonella peptonophila TaxID=112248 RepID=A0A1M4V7I9_9BACL|nr:hypothetical protein SAMN05444392_102214 [Seinonella peptonophila]
MWQELIRAMGISLFLLPVFIFIALLLLFLWNSYHFSKRVTASRQKETAQVSRKRHFLEGFRVKKRIESDSFSLAQRSQQTARESNQRFKINHIRESRFRHFQRKTG